jgi:hypothetical protein
VGVRGMHISPGRRLGIHSTKLDRPLALLYMDTTAAFFSHGSETIRHSGIASIGVLPSLGQVGITHFHIRWETERRLAAGLQGGKRLIQVVGE